MKALADLKKHIYDEHIQALADAQLERSHEGGSPAVVASTNDPHPI